jgi:Flp pilus assembly protein TadD
MPQGDPARAEELYLKALAVQPGHVTVLGNLAGLLAERGEPGRAEVRV